MAAEQNFDDWARFEAEVGGGQWSMPEQKSQQSGLINYGNLSLATPPPPPEGYTPQQRAVHQDFWLRAMTDIGQASLARLADEAMREVFAGATSSYVKTRQDFSDALASGRTNTEKRDIFLFLQKLDQVAQTNYVDLVSAVNRTIMDISSRPLSTTPAAQAAAQELGFWQSVKMWLARPR